MFKKKTTTSTTTSTTTAARNRVLTPAIGVSVLMVVILLTSPLAFATTVGLTSEERETQNQIIETHETATQSIEDAGRTTKDMTFTSRWSEVTWIERGSTDVIFVDCLPGEFPVSSQHILSDPDLQIVQSFAVAIGDDFLSWLAVVQNTDDNIDHAASLGVICAGDGNERTSVLVNPTVKQRINNVVKQHIVIENNQIVNLDQVIKIKNNVTVIANQTGGNVVIPPIVNQTNNGTTVATPPIVIPPPEETPTEPEETPTVPTEPEEETPTEPEETPTEPEEETPTEPAEEVPTDEPVAEETESEEETEPLEVEEETTTEEQQ